MAGDQDKPSIIRWAMRAWRDTAAAIQQMPAALGLGVFIVVAAHVLAETFIVPKPRTGAGISRDLLVFMFGLVEAFLLVPVGIAVHRYVLLGERAASYRLDLANARFRRFFLFTVVIEIIFLIPGMTIGLADKFSEPMQLVVVVAGISLSAYAVVVMLRTLILFPAIAVDAAGAEWSNALRDTQGHAWRMFFMLVVAGVPIIALYVLIVSLWPDDPPMPIAAIVSATDAVMITLITVVYAALASRMFAALAERLTGTHGDDVPQR
ncbi:MAG: hypothetical protein AB1490_16785 [Pseudomonadota bacterium]